MNKISLKIGVFCALALGLFNACSLDIAPISDPSELTEGGKNDTATVILKDKAAADNQLKAIYELYRTRQEHAHLDYVILGEAHADNAYGGTTGTETTPLEVNSVDASNGNFSRDWNRYLKDIAKANVLINGAEQLLKKGAINDAEYRLYKAQGELFRAQMMFRLARIWGSFPVITSIAKTITSNNIEEVWPAYYPPRSTQEECYKQIISDLEYAAQNAPDFDSADRTRLTKPVALAFLAKVYAEKPVQDYDKVIQYAEQVRNTPGIALEPSFSTLWGWNPVTHDCVKRNTSEGIQEIHWSQGASNWESWMYGR